MTILRTRLSSAVKLLEKLKVSKAPRLLLMILAKSSKLHSLLLNKELSLLLLLMVRVKLSLVSKESKKILKLEEVVEEVAEVVVELVVVLMLVQ